MFTTQLPSQLPVKSRKDKARNQTSTTGQRASHAGQSDGAPRRSSVRSRRRATIRSAGPPSDPESLTEAPERRTSGNRFQFTLTPPDSPTVNSQRKRARRSLNARSDQPDRKPRRSNDARPINPRVLRDTSNHWEEGLEFPLSPDKIPISRFPGLAKEECLGPTSRTRRRGNGQLPLTPQSSPDRFINVSPFSADISGSFRLAKMTKELTEAEKLLRDLSASPDPFSPASNAWRRTTASEFGERSRNASDGSRLTTRTLGNGNMTAISQDAVESQNRQASAGAVWNIGGGIHTPPAGPVRAVPNGRGQYMSSGSNAPMYTAKFLDRPRRKPDTDVHGERVAAALDIDRTSRVINVSRPSQNARRGSTGSIGLGRDRSKASTRERTKWLHGEWTQAYAPLLRDDYYCSVLAYSQTAKTLAVGLANKVYLWSEDFGVTLPPPDGNSRPTTFVTSMSFSSTEGRHSILAIGRNTGLLCLWSLRDDEGVRFKAQHPVAISCVAFKPVLTRRQSERFGCMTLTEELLVGCESGHIYYYSVEWMSRDDADIHGWIGSMKLLAKISIHTQQICGIAWSPDGKSFATGANDNACCLFDVAEILKEVDTSVETHPAPRRPLRDILSSLALVSNPRLHQPSIVPSTSSSFSVSDVTSLASNESPQDLAQVVPGTGGSVIIGPGHQKHKWVHSAAVKAIAFCPWQTGLIATGGGSNDRAIHFYHTRSGACLATINVFAQVTSLVWSTTRREIAATFGYAQPEHPYRIAVFSWPECKQVVAIPLANELRALLAVPYPSGPGETRFRTRLGETWYSRTAEEGCLVVACSDESVKFHEVWSGPSRATAGSPGLLGGSSILESIEGVDREGREVIR